MKNMGNVVGDVPSTWPVLANTDEIDVCLVVCSPGTMLPE